MLPLATLFPAGQVMTTSWDPWTVIASFGSNFLDGDLEAKATKATRWAAMMHFLVAHAHLVRRQHHDMQHSVRHLTFPLARRDFGVR